MKIKDCQTREEAFVEVFGDSVFLHAELDVFAMDLQVGFDDPMMSIQSGPLEEESMGPQPPFFRNVQMPLRAANRLVDQRHPAGKTNAPGFGITVQKVAIGYAGYDDSAG